MEENKNISYDLCGKNKENRIMYLPKTDKMSDLLKFYF